MRPGALTRSSRSKASFGPVVAIVRAKKIDEVIAHGTEPALIVDVVSF